MPAETRDWTDSPGAEKRLDQDGLVVIGAGLSRTGTLSTRMALQHLLGGPCYHGSVPVVEQTQHLQSWIEMFEAEKLDPEAAKRLLNGYKGGVDWPVFPWYKELLEVFPNAKRSSSQLGILQVGFIARSSWQIQYRAWSQTCPTPGSSISLGAANMPRT